MQFLNWRTNHIAESGPRRIRDIHHDAVALVNADSQAEIIRQLSAELSDTELDIVRRGRNTRIIPLKMPSPVLSNEQGFEALLGYLYLKGDDERLSYLLRRALQEI
jgi:ribonuclease-3 family protein